MQTAIEAGMADRRHRHMIEIAVRKAFDGIEPMSRVRHEDIAERAATEMLRLIYEDDGVLQQLTADVDRYRKAAEELARLAPPPMIVISKDIFARIDEDKGTS